MLHDSKARLALATAESAQGTYAQFANATQDQNRQADVPADGAGYDSAYSGNQQPVKLGPGREPA
ncbi:hypothetical protein SOV_33270 [Sporomusa ovata DSM 2662]|uniref:Uncharacterized protein n=1 Tax=Sporomusa ovata TaxID=2378 RepID=A0A0U1L2T3_9FIRM|nr:hypothetical protein [Sporomusa ovata]EQB25262.1 hypothetical protein SOV_5c04300 [Sporomusa ovata DSM 2662]CQR73825.1 hypothetical protein SpAn4DRAFT_0287 [Sporomusa ovata]